MSKAKRQAWTVIAKSQQLLRDTLFRSAATGIALICMFAASATANAAASGEEWLQRMAKAIEVSNYRGTIARRAGDRVEYLRVVHKYENGQVTEKLETMDGADRTIIRDVNGVRCFLPESRAVLVEAGSTSTGLFSRIPVSMSRLREQYDVLLLGSNVRVSDRQSVLVALRPHDEFRYGHRLWLEQKSGLPLKTELIDELGKPIEEIRFVNLQIEDSIPNSEFELNINTQGFRFINQAARIDEAAEARPLQKWQSGHLPAGFRLSYSNGIGKGTQHLIFDDGMASVSVFIEVPADDYQPVNGPSRLGGANAYSVVTHRHQITAVGEVPERTVEIIARALSLAEQPREP